MIRPTLEAAARLYREAKKGPTKHPGDPTPEDLAKIISAEAVLLVEVGKLIGKTVTARFDHENVIV
jgi:hypothetical protein